MTHNAERDAPEVTLTEAERRELAYTFHGVQWLSPERAECVERIIANRLRSVIPPGGVIDPRDGEVCCSNPASCAGTAGPGTEGCHISPATAGESA